MEISKHKSEAVSKNLNHLLHCLIYIAHYTCDYNLHNATHISIGFYLYDTMYLMRSAVPSIAPYLLHHSITIYMLSIAINEPAHAASILHGHYILEISNIMLYVSYHAHKECADRKERIMLSELVQLVWYTYYRIFKLSAFIRDIHAEALQVGICVCVMIAMLYAMGLAWSYKLLIKNMHNYKIIKSQNHKIMAH